MSTIEKAVIRNSNLLMGKTITADYNSSEAPRAVDLDLANPWKSVSIGSQSLNADCGSALSISSLVIGNHNMSGCSIALQKSATGVGSWITVDSFTPADNEHIARNFTNETERYWRLQVDNASAAPEVGEWWLCNGVTVFPQYLPGFDPAEKEQSAVIVKGPVATETRERYSYREFKVKLNRTTKTFADQVIAIFKETGTEPFWFDWDGSGVPVFVRLAKPAIQAKGAGHGRVSLDISLEECLAVGAAYDSSAEKDKRTNEPVFALKLELFNKPIFGRATGGSSTTLVDSAADFVDRGVQVGDRAYNETDDLYRDITSIGITALKTVTGISFASGDKYVIRANTWADDPNLEEFWLTQKQLFPGCYPVIKSIGAVDEKIDYDRGVSIVGGLDVTLLEWRETSWLNKLMARKDWAEAKAHLYRGYRPEDTSITSDDLELSGTYLIKKAVGIDRIRLRMDSFLGALNKPAQKITELFHLDYLGTDRIEISVNGVTLKIWQNDEAEPFIEYDLTSDAYSTVQEVRDALQNNESFSASVVATGMSGKDSSVISDMDRLLIDPQDGLVINGLQKTYSGAPKDVFLALMEAYGIGVTQLDMYDVEQRFYWIFDWYVEQRPSLNKNAYTVLAEFMISCGGWIRTGLKRDITGTATGGSAITLENTGGNFIVWDVAVGDTVNNITDGSTGVVTGVDTTEITMSGGLSGGIDNDFDPDDEYQIVATPREVFSCRILAPGIPGEINDEITNDHIIEGTINVDHQSDNYFGKCQVEYDFKPVEDKYMGKVIVDDPENEYHSVAEAGDEIVKIKKLKAPWLRGAGASVRAGILAERRLYWQRTNNVKVMLNALLNRDDIEPGDTILLTSPLLPSIDGNGVTGHKFLVIRKKINPDMKNKHITFELQEADFGGDSPFILAPDGTPEWTSASAEEKQNYGFLTDDKGIMSDGTEGKVLY